VILSAKSSQLETHSLLSKEAKSLQSQTVQVSGVQFCI